MTSTRETLAWQHFPTIRSTNSSHLCKGYQWRQNTCPILQTSLTKRNLKNLKLIPILLLRLRPRSQISKPPLVHKKLNHKIKSLYRRLQRSPSLSFHTETWRRLNRPQLLSHQARLRDRDLQLLWKRRVACQQVHKVWDQQALLKLKLKQLLKYRLQITSLISFRRVHQLLHWHNIRIVSVEKNLKLRSWRGDHHYQVRILRRLMIRGNNSCRSNYLFLNHLQLSLKIAPKMRINLPLCPILYQILTQSNRAPLKEAIHYQAAKEDSNPVKIRTGPLQKSSHCLLQNQWSRNPLPAGL